MKNKHLFNMKDLSLKTISTLIVLVSFNVIQAQNKNQEAFKNATFGYQAGAGLSFGPLDIDVRKDGSLGSISSKFVVCLCCCICFPLY